MSCDVCDTLAWFCLVCIELRAIEGPCQNHELQDDLAADSEEVIPCACNSLHHTTQNDFRMFPSAKLFAKLFRASTRCFCEKKDRVQSFFKIFQNSNVDQKLHPAFCTRPMIPMLCNGRGKAPGGQAGLEGLEFAAPDGVGVLHVPQRECLDFYDVSDIYIYILRLSMYK